MNALKQNLLRDCAQPSLHVDLRGVRRWLWVPTNQVGGYIWCCRRIMRRCLAGAWHARLRGACCGHTARGACYECTARSRKNARKICCRFPSDTETSLANLGTNSVCHL